MNRSLTSAAAATLLIAAVIIGGCAQPSTSTSTGAPPRAQTVRGDAGAADQARLEERQCETLLTIEGIVAEGHPDPDYLDCLYASARSIEEARHALAGLEAQRVATQAIFDECIMRGEPLPDLGIAVLESLARERLAILASVGLGD